MGPSNLPTGSPTMPPTESPTNLPTRSPTEPPTKFPTNVPTGSPTIPPTESPTNLPTGSPTVFPTESPTNTPRKLLQRLPLHVVMANPSIRIANQSIHANGLRHLNHVLNIVRNG